MNKSNGFTLIELMVTLAVLAFVVTLGVPQLVALSDNNRLVSSGNALVRDLHVARSEAVKRGMAVTICGSTDGASCNTGNWEDGWIVFADANRNTVPDGGDTLLSVQGSMSGNITMRSSIFNTAGLIQYLPNGQLSGADRGTLTVCDPNGDAATARAINLNNLGRPSKATDTNSSGTVNDVNGNDIACP